MTMSLGRVVIFRMSSLVTIFWPSGSRPGSDLTREPVAMITSVAWRTRSPPLPGVPSSPGCMTRTFWAPSRRPRPATQVTLFLSMRRLEAGPHPLHDLVAPGGHLGVVDDGLAGQVQAEVLGMADLLGEGGQFEERLGRDAAAVEARAADLVLVDERDLQAELARRGRPRHTRPCPHRARRDRSHWTSRRPWVRVPREASARVPSIERRGAARAGGSS